MEDQAVVAVLVLALGAIALVAVPALVVSSRRRIRQTSTDFRMWRAVAHERGGTVDPARGPRAPSGSAIDVEVGDVAVRLEARFVSERDIDVRDPETRRLKPKHEVAFKSVARASFLLPLGPVFRLQPGRGSRLGASPDDAVSLGDTDFDRRFLVKSDDPTAVKSIWTRRAMDLVLEHFPEGVVHSDGVVVTLECDEALDDQDRVEAALDLLGELAGAERHGLDVLAELPGALYVSPEGPWDDRSLPYYELDEAVPVMIGPIVHGDRAVTQVEIGEVAWDLELTLEDDDGRFDTAGLELPPGAVALLEAAGPGTLTVDRERAAFRWHEIETDERRLLAGVRVVAAFGVAPGQGAYR